MDDCHLGRSGLQVPTLGLGTTFARLLPTLAPRRRHTPEA
jgi:hypothetical protein